MSTQTLLVHLPTPESREEYLHSLHWLAIDVVVRMKSSGFNVAAFHPYDSPSPLEVEFEHFQHGTMLCIRSPDVKWPTRVSLNCYGHLVNVPLAWGLLDLPSKPLDADSMPFYEQSMANMASMARAADLLHQIGALVVYPRAREFWGPNFKPALADLGPAVHEAVESIPMTEDLRRALDSYREHVADTGYPGVLLPERERKPRPAREKPTAKPRVVTDEQLPLCVLQALLDHEGNLRRMEERVLAGEREVWLGESARLGIGVGRLTHKVFGLPGTVLFYADHPSLVARVEQLVREFQEAGLVEPCMNDGIEVYRLAVTDDALRYVGLEPITTDDTLPDFETVGSTLLLMPWIIDAPTSQALEWLQVHGDMSLHEACAELDRLRGW